MHRISIRGGNSATEPTAPPHLAGAIRALLLLLLIADVLALPLLLIPHGVIEIGHAVDGAVYVPGTIQLRFPELLPGDVALSVRRTGYGQYLLYSTGHGLAAALAAIPILIYARRLIQAALTDDPFTPPMVRRLRRLGAMILAGGLLSEAGAYVANLVLLRISLPDDELLRLSAYPDQTLSGWWVLPGLILLAVSEVVRRGCDLRAELEGVI